MAELTHPLIDFLLNPCSVCADVDRCSPEMDAEVCVMRDRADEDELVSTVFDMGRAMDAIMSRSTDKDRQKLVRIQRTMALHIQQLHGEREALRAAYTELVVACEMAPPEALLVAVEDEEEDAEEPTADLSDMDTSDDCGGGPIWDQHIPPHVAAATKQRH